MRFLADENFPGDAVRALQAAGHDVAWIRTDRPGCTDDEVLALAIQEQRIILTFDKDFGELAWARALPPSCGIVLFRLPMPMIDVGDRLAKLLESRTDWAGHFAVIEASRIRMRPLPRLH